MGAVEVGAELSEFKPAELSGVCELEEDKSDEVEGKESALWEAVVSSFAVSVTALPESGRETVERRDAKAFSSSSSLEDSFAVYPKGMVETKNKTKTTPKKRFNVHSPVEIPGSRNELNL